MVDPITQRIIQGVHKKVKMELLSSARDPYKTVCPQCHRVLVKTAFFDYGCFACGYKELNLE